MDTTGQNPIQNTPHSSNKTLVLFLSLLVFILLMGNIYFLTKTSTSKEIDSVTRQQIFEPLLTNTDAKIISMDNEKKLVIVPSPENPYFDIIYLSDKSLNQSTTTKLIDTLEGNSSGGKVGQIFDFAPAEGLQIFLIEIGGPDGGPDYAIIKDDGTVVSDSIVFNHLDSPDYNYAYIAYYGHDFGKSEVIMSLTNRGTPGSTGTENEKIYYADLDLTTGKLGSLRTEPRTN